MIENMYTSRSYIINRRCPMTLENLNIWGFHKLYVSKLSIYIYPFSYHFINIYIYIYTCVCMIYLSLISLFKVPRWLASKLLTRSTSARRRRSWVAFAERAAAILMTERLLLMDMVNNNRGMGLTWINMILSNNNDRNG